MNMKNAISKTQLLLTLMVAVALLSVTAFAAAPGITSTNGTAATFNLTAQQAFLNQPDGESVYSWGYGCVAGTPTFVPAAITTGFCPTMQVPGPTLVVAEGATVTVNLVNNLPTSAGNTSILFPGFQVTATGGVAGILTQEAAPGSTVTYTFKATSPGTRAYYSGTQGDLQIEMGLYGAIIVLPTTAGGTLPTCPVHNTAAGVNNATNPPTLVPSNEADFRLAPPGASAPGAAYHVPQSCYDREYLFQFAEMDTNIHRTALAQVTSLGACTAGAPGCYLAVPTEPYHPAYFLINGRSMPDDMDANYAAEYPHQPYNGDPHMHPGENTLIRVIGQGRWEHPFHEHANHVRILARDGNLILAPDGQNLAGILMFTTDTFPGQSFDGIFYFTGRGLNWDAYGHHPVGGTPAGFPIDPLASLPCTPDANGYNTGNLLAVNYYEWCADHNKPIQKAPFGDVNGGGPATLPDANIFTNGPWYGGTPYLGPDATLRAGNANCDTVTNANCALLQPTNIQANPANERGWAFMWHSHNEREITTNNVFPGGMLMMMLVDTREFVIDETN
jgi:FtsP/CotA-like multicopper oxidase with cupredoxin domain